MLNRASGTGWVSSKIISSINNIWANGNFVNADVSRYFLNGTMGKTMPADTFADFGKVMRLTENTITDSCLLNLPQNGNCFRGKMVTLTVKAKTSSTNFKIAIDTSSGGFFSGKYHSGNGTFEILSLTIKIADIASLYLSPLLLLADPVMGSYVDIAWVTLSIGCVTPTQYIPCNTI